MEQLLNIRLLKSKKEKWSINITIPDYDHTLKSYDLNIIKTSIESFSLEFFFRKKENIKHPIY
jgi:DNA-directed RNA polymerase subunit L